MVLYEWYQMCYLRYSRLLAMGAAVVRAGNPRYVDPSLYAHTLEGKAKVLAEEEGKSTTYK